jgi:hypothetical protein
MKLHVDDFIDTHFTKEPYARWVLNHFRLPAALKNDFEKFMKEHKLFCMYEGKKYRVTGASRLGDIWLSEDFNKDHGYNKRVDAANCSGWSPD